MFKRFLIFVLCFSMCILHVNLVMAFDIDELEFADISIETDTSITRDLALITQVNGAELSWSSNKPTVISNTGVVTRPLPNEDPVEVTLTAEEISTGATKIFPVTVMPFRDDEEVVKKIKSWLDFSLLSSEELTSVKNNFTLLTTGIYDSVIYWESTDESIVTINGTDALVSRPPVGEGTANVILTANIAFGESLTKEYFLLQVPAHDYSYVGNKNLKDAFDAFEREFLSVQNITDIRNDLIIPTSNHKSISITLSSDSTEYLSDEGKITRSVTEDVIVNLIVTFRYGYETLKRSFPIVIKAIEEDTLIKNIENDLQWLKETLNKNHKFERLTESIKIENNGPNGTTFSYFSNNEAVVSNSGIVIRQDSDCDVILTVYGYAHGETLTISIPITVLAKASSSVQDGGTAISGGVGGGSPYAQIEDAYLISSDFNDLPVAHWAYDAVHYLYERDIIDGVGNNMFAPDKPVTREQFLKMLINSPLNFNVDYYEIPFMDVDKNSWYYPFVSTAYYYGLINGVSENSFGTGAPILRQDLAVIINGVLGRLENKRIVSDNYTFNDMEDVSEYAKNSVSNLKRYGLISGKGNNYFCPKDTLTRAEASMIIYRLLTLK